ncbi:hypothetical protein [Desulfopila aestuarii]|uniref:Uncharacterized protein n=1 Tax=Desulfopila aestuarii DSM 18488 TaxID=1121416 RepID=A0A1M7Y8L9_9BACT|nr:hypothetical protein [Desulfopila aestuarii]SHO48983.1 hypothetical protein SAMN02745220_02584 [Desulfopila aestuarii DSM 18488]
MTLSAVSNTIVAKNQVTQQKTGTATEQSEGKKSNGSSDAGFSGKKFDDTVTLSQADKAGGPAKTVDAKSIEQVLPRTKAAILQDSKTAVTTQANINAQTAQEFLSEK